MNTSLRFKTASLAALLSLVASQCGALEISLEENKAERGNIGYIDMPKVFRLYPETHKAKETYKEIVRQAEEQVNLRRGEVLALRAELSQLKLERDILEKSPVEKTTAPAPVPPPPAVEPSEEAEPTTDDPPVAERDASSSAAADLTSAATAHAKLDAELDAIIDAAPGPEEKTPESTAGEIVINIPGISEEKALVAPPAGENAAKKQKEKTASAPHAPLPGEDSLKMRERILKELDSKIGDKEALYSAKEAEFSAYQASVEKNLIEIESRRSEILLGKIYKAVRQVAQENGVSIVVDKNQIIYGQSTVDLTSKVLQRLKELPL